MTCDSCGAECTVTIVLESLQGAHAPIVLCRGCLGGDLTKVRKVATLPPPAPAKTTTKAK